MYRLWEISGEHNVQGQCHISKVKSHKDQHSNCVLYISQSSPSNLCHSVSRASCISTILAIYICTKLESLAECPIRNGLNKMQPTASPNRWVTLVTTIPLQPNGDWEDNVLQQAETGNYQLVPLNLVRSHRNLQIHTSCSYLLYTI